MKKIQIVLLLIYISFTVGNAQNIIYVDSSATGLNNGNSWVNAYKYIQDAVAEANQINDASVIQIWIANGTYFPDDGANITKEDREAFIELESNIHLFGGFTGSENNLAERSVDLEDLRTIVSGDIGFKNYNADNSNNLIKGYDAINVVIDGIKFIDAYSVDINKDWFDQTVRWGALYFNNCNVNISHCFFTNNKSNLDAGAINVDKTYLDLDNCTFTQNTTSDADLNGSQNYEIFLENLDNDEYKKAIITNCRFDTTETNVLFNNGYLKVINSYFTRIGGKALKVGNFGSNEIINSTFENIYSSSTIIDELAYHDQLILSNCLFNNITNYGTIIGLWCKEDVPDISIHPTNPVFHFPA
jgi:hypothetical protein